MTPTDPRVVLPRVVLVDPQIPIPRKVTEITGISDSDVAGAPRFTEIADEVFELLKDSIAVPYLVIWRPRGISFAPGRRYRVTLEGLTRDGKPKPVRYYVEFFDHAYERPRLPRRG